MSAARTRMQSEAAGEHPPGAPGDLDGAPVDGRPSRSPRRLSEPYSAPPAAPLDGREPFQRFPPLSEDEFAALKADIAERGVLVPVELDERGRVLDGHHRLRAWSELRAEGVRVPPYPRVVRVLGDDAARVEHALVLNLARRHLSRAERGGVARELAGRGISGRRIAELLGVSPRTLRRDLSGGAYAPPEDGRVVGVDGKRYRARPPSSILATSDRDERRARDALGGMGERAPEGLIPLGRAEERARVELLDQRRSTAASGSLDGAGWQLHAVDFRQVDLPELTAGAVICDPPYGAGFEGQWVELARFSARVLRRGRPLVAYCGHLNLPQVMCALGEHLEYVWAGVTVQDGRHGRIHHRQVRSGHRPWLVFSAGPFEPTGWVEDTLRAGGRGERSVADHPWRQALGPFVRLVEMFTRPGDVVVDPCCGQGTTGVAAVTAGRRFVGVDLDPAAVSLAADQLRAVDIREQRR